LVKGLKKGCEKMKKFIVSMIFVLLAVSFPTHAYIRDANLTKAVDCIGIGYSPFVVSDTILLNIYGEKKLDDSTGIGFLYGRCMGKVEANIAFEMSVNKLLYGKKDEGFAISGLLGFWVGELYRGYKFHENNVVVDESYAGTGEYVYLPELGLVFSYTPNDIFYARANLVFGIQFGLELGYKIFQNMEISAALSPINMVGIKYLF
jgi:hypothetical protein